eukprot:GHUV01027226.1.p1 GENE.GHUV01027226.1~~GHUV01027226.1.p1  ORF type:complete len:135 (+),score=11.14 GHUV01027226.1:301-705(+)
MHTVLFKRASPLHLRKPGNQQYYCNLLSSAHSQPRRAQRRVGRMSAAAAVVCSPLWARVIEVYDKAQESGAATKTDTKVMSCLHTHLTRTSSTQQSKQCCMWPAVTACIFYRHQAVQLLQRRPEMCIPAVYRGT